MLVALICTDKPGHGKLRQETRPAHLAYIEATGVVSMAGPLLMNERVMGSLIILDVPDIAAAEAWAVQDPYGKAELFSEVEAVEWRKVIG